MDCFYCGVANSAVCLGCQLVGYCSDEHLKIHRPGDYCLPFKVAYQEGVGRCLVATRDIAPLELVLWDSAAVLGPGADTLPVCLECLCRLPETWHPCTNCGFPLCSVECEGKKFHSQECKLFSAIEKKPMIKNINEKHPIYCTIAPLRLLILKESNPTIWKRVNALMDNNEARFASDPNLVEMFEMIVKFFINEMYLTNTDADEIKHIIGVLMTNGFENDNMGITGRALYPTLSLCSHSCQSNLRHAVSPGKQVALQAQAPIKAGTELTIRYTHLLQSILKRRLQIKDSWFFLCSCVRCSDPTECGTMASAVVCPGCRVGVLLPVNSLDLESNWSCKQCGHQTDHKFIRALEEKVEHDIDEVSSPETGNGFNEKSVHEYQLILDKYKPYLAPSHCLMVITKRYIHAIKGNSDGMELGRLSCDELEDKLRFCRSFLRYLGRLDPGYGQHAALTTLELCKADIELSKRRASAGELSKDDLLNIISENMKMQAQANRWLTRVKVNGPFSL